MQEEFAVTLEQHPTKEFTHHYLGFKIHRSECRVKIWEISRKVFVLFEDVGIGTSVTNAIEQLIQEVYDTHLKDKFTPGECLFAETYEDKEGIDLVLCQWEGNELIDFKWKHLGVLAKQKSKRVWGTAAYKPK